MLAKGSAVVLRIGLADGPAVRKVSHKTKLGSVPGKKRALEIKLANKFCTESNPQSKKLSLI